MNKLASILLLFLTFSLFNDYSYSQDGDGDRNCTECPSKITPDPGGGLECTQYDYDDHIMQLKNCVPLLWQQKLICKPYVGKCCDANKQKNCSGSGFPL